jgi:peptidyl-prolyl cis-trans isomerase D
MSLLDNLRRGTESTAMKVFFVIVVITFVFWGVDAQMAGGGTTSTLVQIGSGDRITDMDYQRRMRDLTQRMQVAPDEDQLKTLGRQVLQGMIEEKVALHEARRLDVEVSDDELARYILQYEAFKDESGKFNAKLYEKQLKRMGLTKGRFEEKAREAMMLEKLRRTAVIGAQVLEPEVKRRYQESETQLELQLVRIPDELVLDKVPVDEPAIDAFLGASEAEVKTQYDSDFNRLYNLPKKASIRTIVLRSDVPSGDGSEVETGITPALRQRAEAIAKEAATKGFAELARRYSEDLSAGAGGDLGTVTEAEMDPAVAKVVFATPPGSVSQVVETGRGLEILKVESAEDARSIPFDEVKREIARDMIARKEVGRVAGELAEKILAEWKATGTAPEKLLEESHLTVMSTGPMSPADPSPILESSPDVLAAALAAGKPGVLDGVYPSANGRVVAAVASYQAPDPEGYAEKAEDLRNQMLYEARVAFLDAWTKDLVAHARVDQKYEP